MMHCCQAEIFDQNGKEKTCGRDGFAVVGGVSYCKHHFEREYWLAKKDKDLAESCLEDARRQFGFFEDAFYETKRSTESRFHRVGTGELIRFLVSSMPEEEIESFLKDREEREREAEYIHPDSFGGSDFYGPIN